MNILIIDNGTHFLPHLKRLCGNNSVSVFDEKDEYPNFKFFDLVILSGGSRLPVVGNAEEYSREINIVKNTNKPLLGICLGFEIVAYAYGVVLKRMEEKERDYIEIKKLKNDPIFAGLDTLHVFESHRWVVESVKDELEALAVSKDGIEIIRHKEKLMYGFQFHPEMFPDKTTGNELFYNFMNQVNAEIGDLRKT